jgi:site-specific DNA recombinase
MPPMGTSATTRSPARPSTAVIYLRVSSTGQLTGYNAEGYSIEGQREACERHAARLGAEVIAEFVELGRTGTNLRRPALQTMLAELPRLKPTFVVFYDLSRVAREEQDAFWLLGEIKRHGAKLESTLERIDDSPQGLLLYAIMAGVNAFRSRGDAEKVKLGLQRKFADGGCVGKAPIGYINDRVRIEGREVRVVTVDPERAPLVRMAFDAYASGRYSLTELADLLEQSGLRTRQTAKCAPAPLSRTQVHRMLRDQFYLGVVCWDGMKKEGRHEAIIDRDTFEQVERVLKSAMLSGNRTRKHKHYLRGSIYCGHCGRRMVFHRIRGKGGTYDYLGCLSHQGRGRHACDGGYVQTAKVEQAIESYYSQIRLTGRQQQTVRRAVREYAEGHMLTAQRESDRHTRRLQELHREQQKLLHLFYKGSIAEEVVEAEQTRIETERSQAQHWAKVAAHDATDIMHALDEALALLTDPQVRYRQAPDEVRRLINQALFEKLYVRDEGINDAQPLAWVQDIQRLADTPHESQNRCQPTRQHGRQHDHDRLPAAMGFHKDQMVRARGLEPPRAFAHRLLSSADPSLVAVASALFSPFSGCLSGWSGRFGNMWGTRSPG